MGSVWAVVIFAERALALFVIGSVLRQRKEPMAMLAWILTVLFLPGLGMVLYWLMGSNRLVRHTHRRRRRVAHLITQVQEWTRQSVADGKPDELPEDLAGIARLGQRLAQMPAIGGNEVRIYEEADATYGALEDAIRGARHHVHMEYYIWQPDETGCRFRDLIVEKARSGVECRLLLDSVGCWRLGRRFLKPLTDAGAQVAFFLPVDPLGPLKKRFSPHMRNHRKIVVVDGQVAFTGSQNVGDEYRGRLRRFGLWHDTHMRVDGPAALFLQRTFAEDWLFATRQNLAGEEYFFPPRRPGNSIVQIMPTGPDQNVSPLEQIIFAAVSSARESIRIATPYFVPDPGLRLALIHACSREVKVDLVLPTRSDQVIVLWAGRSFYGELLDAGVRIHEYERGMLHSKLMTVDDRWCLLGSANMDVRSFSLNFEITALIYDPAVARELSTSIGRIFHRSRQITARIVHNRPVHQQLLEGTARLLTPLL